MVKLTTKTVFGFLILLLWFPEKGLSYTSVGVYFGGPCYASCDNTAIAPYEEIINRGEGRCFLEGTECEVAACCRCYDRQTGKNTTFTFNRCESFREQFGGDYAENKHSFWVISPDAMVSGKDLSSISVSTMLFGGQCYASCGNKSIAPYAEIINRREERCFWEGPDCEVAACCICYNRLTGQIQPSPLTDVKASERNSRVTTLHQAATSHYVPSWKQRPSPRLIYSLFGAIALLVQYA